jgi:cell division protein FtsZ
MVFITAGMGGGTGTGAAPIIAGVARNMGALTVAVVTKPFEFEGAKRMELAEEGIAALKDKVDTLIVVPNQRLLEIIDPNEKLSFIDAMKKVDSVLAEGVNSISNLISQTGYINADFNDAKSVMQNAGTALMGIGRASGENRAEEAARAATTSPLLDMSIEGAKGVLYNIVGADLTLTEISLVSELIREAVDPSANIKFGAQIDPNAGDELTITIVATGFSDQPYTKRQSEISVGGTSRIRTFGFEPENKVNNAEIVKESEDEEESFESFDAVDAMPVDSFDNGDDSFTDSEKLKDIPTDDPLDIPAFMRKKK